MCLGFARYCSEGRTCAVRVAVNNGIVLCAPLAHNQMRGPGIAICRFSTVCTARIEH
jgi:hypothetical protein